MGTRQQLLCRHFHSFIYYMNLHSAYSRLLRSAPDSCTAKKCNFKARVECIRVNPGGAIAVPMEAHSKQRGIYSFTGYCPAASTVYRRELCCTSSAWYQSTGGCHCPHRPCFHKANQCPHGGRPPIRVWVELQLTLQLLPTVHFDDTLYSI